MLLRLRRSKPRHRKTREDGGSTAVEYGMLVAAIAAVIVSAVFFLGGMVKSAFQQTCAAIQSSLPSDGTCNPGDSPPGL